MSLIFYILVNNTVNKYILTRTGLKNVLRMRKDFVLLNAAVGYILFFQNYLIYINHT